MQNAQNLMSSFEFIAALMSIIIGLGVTNLLAGAGRAFYRRKENPLDEVHIVLTLATLLLLVLQWWVTFKWNTEITWSFDRFLLLIVWTITLYMLTVFLYPPDLSEAEEHQRRFQRNRVGYYSAFIAMCVLDIAQTAVHGDLLIFCIRFGTSPLSVITWSWRQSVWSRIDRATIVSLRGIN